jgi:integrase
VTPCRRPSPRRCWLTAALHGPGLWPPDAPGWVSLARNGTAGQGLGLSSIADLGAKHLGTSKVHALRPTYARAMEDAGAKVSDIQARLGHSSLSTTGAYLNALRTAENAQGDALAGLLGLDG